MFKNKLKQLLIILLIIFISLSPLCFAVDDVPSESAETPAPPAPLTQTPEENAVQATKENNSNKDNVKHGDQYIIEDNATIDYVIDGNLYVLANNVTIKSQIIGNVFIAANTVKITEQGYISNTLYVAANTVQIAGIVFDIYSTSKSIDITGYIYRDIHCVGESVNIFGTIGRNASIASPNISFEENNSAASNSQSTEPITFSKRIMGDLEYSSKEENSAYKNFVEGSVNYNNLKTINTEINPIFVIISIVILVIAVWGLLKWLAPKFLEKSSDLVSKKIYKTLGFGLAGLLLIPIISVLFIICIVTAPLGFLLLIIYALLLLISEIIFAIALSNLLAKKFNMTSTPKFLLVLLIITLLIYVIELIPVISPLISFTSILIGIGIIVRRLISKEDKQ